MSLACLLFAQRSLTHLCAYLVQRISRNLYRNFKARSSFRITVEAHRWLYAVTCKALDLCLFLGILKKNRDFNKLRDEKIPWEAIEEYRKSKFHKEVLESFTMEAPTKEVIQKQFGDIFLRLTCFQGHRPSILRYVCNIQRDMYVTYS